MSCNRRVTDQVKRMVEAYGTDRYKIEEEKYWQIFEEEFRKEPQNGWASWEDPADALGEAIIDDDGKERVAELLECYKRFYGITGWEMDEELIRSAEAYIS